MNKLMRILEEMIERVRGEGMEPMYIELGRRQSAQLVSEIQWHTVPDFGNPKSPPEIQPRWSNRVESFLGVPVHLIDNGDLVNVVGVKTFSTDPMVVM